MRLIDADYTKEHLRASELNGRRLHIMELEERLALIDEVPTVEAIPVKWLQDRCRLYRDCDNDLRAHVIENEIELWRVKNRKGE